MKVTILRFAPERISIHMHSLLKNEMYSGSGRISSPQKSLETLDPFRHLHVYLQQHTMHFKAVYTLCTVLK